jgi:hypothetical protein
MKKSKQEKTTALVRRTLPVLVLSVAIFLAVAIALTAWFEVSLWPMAQQNRPVQNSK